MARDPFEGPTWSRRAERVDAPLVFPELPSEVAFGCLGELLPTSLRFELRLQLHRMPNEAALELLDRARAVAIAELESGSSGAEARAAQLEREADGARAIAARVAAREQELWRVGISAHALAGTLPRAEKLRAELARLFRAKGFRPRPPTYEADAATAPPDLFGTERRPRGYWHTLPTDGAAAFFPFVDETVAEPGGVLVGLHLVDAAPVFLDRWSHASHSWGVFGTTGSGKTYFAALTAMRSFWMRPDLETIILDPLGEFGGLARALGGTVIGVAEGRGGRWNPLDPATTGPDRSEKAGRVGAVLRALYPSLLDEEVGALDRALAGLYREGPEVPHWNDLLEALDRSDPALVRLRSLLEVFRGGSLAFLDGPTTAAWDPRLTVVDLTGVPDAQLPFHLAYLLDAVEGRCRERPGPKLLIVDEAYRLVRDAGTASYLDALVRHLRHYQAGVMLLSQSPEDFLQLEAGRSILRNLRTTFLLRLTDVSKGLASAFELTELEVAWLRSARLPRETGYAEALLRFGPAHLPIGLIASTPEFEFLEGALGRPRAPSDREGRRDPLA